MNNHLDGPRRAGNGDIKRGFRPRRAPTRHDVSQWPLVVSIIDGPLTSEALRELAGHWHDWLSWNEPFAALRIFSDAQTAAQLDHADDWARQWLETHRWSIRRNVVGLASVVPGAQYDRMPELSRHNVFGIPAATFASVSTALCWLEARAFRPYDLPFNRDAAERALARVA